MALQGDSTTIMIRLDLMLVKKKTSLSNLSVLEKGKVKSIRFSSLEAICRELYSQPWDILEWHPDFVPEPGTRAPPHRP